MRSHRRSGLTLVEVLIAVAIIAVLALIMFPAISSMTEKSREASCISRMRQLSAILFSYAYDNRGFMPRVYEENGALPWGGMLVEKGLLSPESLVTSTQRVNPSPLICPGSKARFSGYQDWLRGHYGLNSELVGAGGIGGDPSPSTSITNLKSANTIVLFMDGGAYSLNSFYAGYPGHQIWYLPGSSSNKGVAWDESNAEDALKGRHSGRVNVCFADGHIEAVYADSLKDNRFWKPEL